MLHALSNLRLYEVLVDLVNIDLWQLLQMLYSTIRHVLLAWLDNDEDMLEELSHHLLHRVDYADVEAVQGELQHRTIVQHYKRGEPLEWRAPRPLWTSCQ